MTAERRDENTGEHRDEDAAEYRDEDNEGSSGHKPRRDRIRKWHLPVRTVTIVLLIQLVELAHVIIDKLV